MVYFTRPTKKDLKLLAETMRPEDREETLLMTGKEPQHSLLPNLLKDPSVTFAIRDDHNILLAMCGAMPHQREGVGVVWFLARPEIERHPLSLIKVAPQYLALLSEPYPYGLTALLWDGNHMHLKWAKAVGFTTQTIIDVGGEPFHLIHRSRKSCAFRQLR